MNVIGIVQTDLNEFSVLFDQEQDRQGKGEQNPQSSGNQDGSEDSMFFGIADEFMGHTDTQSRQPQDDQQKGPQEMTVRIKGIPEGQKANFLQMYQILQDAQDVNSLEKWLTIVNDGDDQNSRKGGQNNKKRSNSQ